VKHPEDHLSNDYLPGSAWHTWKHAGYRWRSETPDFSEAALINAANAYASIATGENESKTRKRAFIKGARRFSE
jgi:hypothetical protein